MRRRKCADNTTYNAKGNNEFSTKASNETFKEDETRNAILMWLNANQVILKLMVDENIILNQQYSSYSSTRLPYGLAIFSSEPYPSIQLPDGVELLDSDGNAIINASFDSIRSTSNSVRYEGNRYYVNNITLYYEDGRRIRTAEHGITHVIVKDGVTSIVDYAFKNWKDLVSVHLSSSVTIIGYESFKNCSLLSSINLPDSLQTIGIQAFYNCTSLSEINLPNSLTSIGISAFCGCSSLSSITIPPSITRIERSTFAECSSLSQVTIPPSVTSISWKGFAGCKALKTIQIPNALQSIGHHAFHECTSLESIHIPTSVTSIGHRTFLNCTSLKVIYTPSSTVQKIFTGYNLTNLIILTDTNHFNYRGIPSITLHNIQQCIDHLPNDMDIPPHQQLHTLHHSLQQRFPRIAERTQQSSLNLLHLLVYFPCTNDDDDIYQPLLTLLTKYPQVMIAVDSSGRTPLHHAMTSTRHIMNSNCYDLLLDRCPDRVVHLAIRSVVQSLVLQSSPWRWDDVCDMVYAKMNALSMEDVESGLLPFMMVAEASNDVEGLSMVYELLCLNPGVLKVYCSCLKTTTK